MAKLTEQDHAMLQWVARNREAFNAIPKEEAVAFAAGYVKRREREPPVPLQEANEKSVEDEETYKP